MDSKIKTADKKAPFIAQYNEHFESIFPCRPPEG